MNLIEQQIYEFIEQVCLGKASIPDSLIEEFGERCKKTLKDRLVETQEKDFTIRMSNIGRPLRQLMLEQKYGKTAPTPDFVLKMMYGSLYEALVISLLKASNTGLTEYDKKVALKLADIVVDGTLDVIIDGKVYDIKTASPFAYEHKFNSYESLVAKDDFGYLGQGFSYAKANNCKFGGWIVINKATGQMKVVEIPDDIHNDLMDRFIKENEAKVDHILCGKEIPPCEGVVEESYYKKPTGNKILGDSCRFCSYKHLCHPNLQYLPSKTSKSDTPKYVWYVDIKEKE